MVMAFEGQLLEVDGDEIRLKVTDQLLIDTLQSMLGDELPRMELGIIDGRRLSGKQRRKAYAMMHDMADYTGYEEDEFKNVMKSLFYESFGVRPFSFSDGDMTTARFFISFLIEFALEEGIPLRESLVERTDDIEVAMLQAMRHRTCAVCGKSGSDIHHIDAIGMGNDRTKADHRGREMVCLCREHHQRAHTLGWATFSNIQHLQGVVPSEELIRYLGLMTQTRMNEIDGEE